MSELISGKEALIALANGGDVIYINTFYKEKPTRYWGDAKECTVEQFFNGEWIFKIEPRTITINGIEVPAPFEPKDGDKYYHISIQASLGYGWDEWESSDYDARASIFGAWRTEEEIKQVVSALRFVLRVVCDDQNPMPIRIPCFRV